MNRKGGDIFVPYAFHFEGNIISIFDPAIHIPHEVQAEAPKDEAEAAIRRLLNTSNHDSRWVRIRRPVIITGGELSLGMLEPATARNQLLPRPFACESQWWDLSHR